MPLFAEVKQQYRDIFRGNEAISLSDRALASMVSELAKYDLTRTDVDAKGAAYQEIVGINLRGDRGQYFTPRGVIKLAVEILDPQEHERLLDPACDTGGFLVATLAHRLAKIRAEAKVVAGTESNILRQFDLAQVWERLDDGRFRSTGRLQGSVACNGSNREGGWALSCPMASWATQRPNTSAVDPAARLGAGQCRPPCRGVHR
jgi:hypothetical protein